ncbi:nicotinamidase [Chromatiales bacterium (ex Bugula neritina AB1)]|nr:nicotinamidase [Chromatiales bacterium (ex Bugula neritina AB1)]
MKPDENDLLLIIDVQNDFCSDGALAVPGGDDVVPVINKLQPCFRHIAITQDWHPEHHGSFASSHPGKDPFSTIEMPYGEQTLWPDHCIQGSGGAEFHAELNTDPAALIIRKGMNPAIDSYSAFFENDRTTSTGLSGYLRKLDIKRVFCAGLAYDFCVRFSAGDASREGFKTFVISDACRAIDIDNSAALTTEFLEKNNIELITSELISPESIR